MQIDQIIIAARDCIGTPFVPQGRLPGVGLDCAGLILHALQAGGITIDDVASYTIPPDPTLLIDALAQGGFMQQDQIMPGAVLLFRFQGRAQHLALAISDNTMIHAFAPARHVVETDIGSAWRQRLLGSYYVTSLRSGTGVNEVGFKPRSQLPVQ